MDTKELVDKIKALHSSPKVVIYKDNYKEKELNISLEKLCKEIRDADLYICTNTDDVFPEYRDYVLNIRIRFNEILDEYSVHKEMLYMALLEHPITTILLVENRERLLELVPMTIINKLIIL